MRNLSISILVAIFISGCASGPPRRTIAIDSDPQGMHVEVNNAYLGKTPTTYTVETNPQGEFLGSWANAPIVEFVATPPSEQPELFVQRKQFSPNGFFRAGDRIPERIFFNMRQKREGFSIDLPDRKTTKP